MSADYTDEWVKAWRESEDTGKRYNDSFSGVTDKTSSLDRHFAQLRQASDKRFEKDHSTFRTEEQLKAYLRKNGYLYGESLEQTKVFFADEWDKILAEYDSWREAMERCYLVLKSKNPNQKGLNKKGIITQCQTRFSPKKKKETRWRMEQFSEKMKKGGIRRGLQITLTTDPKRFGDLNDVGAAWKIYIEKFMDFANARLRRAGKKNTTCYLKACELTESGLLHVHIGFYGPGITGKLTKTYADGTTKTDYLFPQKDVKALWSSYGVGEIVHINKAPVNELCDYITKHVSKSWGGESNDMLEAFLHYTGMRQWSSSMGAIPKSPSAIERWEVVTVAFTPVEALIFRENLIKDGHKFIKDDLAELFSKSEN